MGVRGRGGGHSDRHNLKGLREAGILYIIRLKSRRSRCYGMGLGVWELPHGEKVLPLWDSWKSIWCQNEEYIQRYGMESVEGQDLPGNMGACLSSLLVCGSIWD